MKILVAFFSLLFSGCVFGQANDTITSLFENSYRVYQLQRLDNGMYRDSKLFAGEDYHPVSIANTGIGLVSLCIADTMDWETNARSQALQTLKTVTGHHAKFKPDTNATGYFRHFMEIDSGNNAWGSEYSTIDTDLLMSGALFCDKYFQDDSISRYVDMLWESIDFGAAIHDPARGTIFREMNKDGTGDPNSLTLPYNEYMIVAWLACLDSSQADSRASRLWNTYYARTDNLPKPSYDGIPVLSDHDSSFLSSFTHQFNYYLCHYFGENPAYLEAYRDAYRADFAWWQDTSGVHAYEWGSGAGSADNASGYHADKIEENPSLIVSPHIIAGFLPVNPQGKEDLLSLYRANKGVFELPLNALYHILWRFSLENPMWRANEVQGIDYSSMLFGLASLPEYLGPEFFFTYNNFVEATHVSLDTETASNLIIYPNPAEESVYMEMEDAISVELSLLDIKGRKQKISVRKERGRLEVDLSQVGKGLYFVVLKRGETRISRKVFIWK